MTQRRGVRAALAMGERALFAAAAARAFASSAYASVTKTAPTLVRLPLTLTQLLAEGTPPVVDV